MNDWIAKNTDWITSDYHAYRRKRRRKHSKSLFYKHIKEGFANRGVRWDLICSAPEIMAELFWQCEVLKDCVQDLTKAIYTGKIYKKIPLSQRRTSEKSTTRKTKRR